MSRQNANKKSFSLKQVCAVALGVMLLTVAATAFAIKFWFFPQPFTPVVLDAKEEKQLEQKLEQFTSFPASSGGGPPPARQEVAAEEPDFNQEGKLQPQAYSEAGANREITFNERELNGLLAKNTNMAEKLAIDFAEDLVSLRLLLPLDPDFPIMGGKTLRLKAGAELAYRDGRPVIMLKGISLMGVPLPNAWLGGLKNIDLMQEFGGDPGFWQSFGEGVEAVQVREGELYVKLRE